MSTLLLTMPARLTSKSSSSRLAHPFAREARRDPMSPAEVAMASSNRPLQLPHDSDACQIGSDWKSGGQPDWAPREVANTADSQNDRLWNGAGAAYGRGHRSPASRPCSVAFIRRAIARDRRAGKHVATGAAGCAITYFVWRPSVLPRLSPFEFQTIGESWADTSTS